MNSNKQNIILASTSPRRKEILSLLGVDFTTVAADIDESKSETETPYEYVHRLAIAKAAKVAATNPDAVVIGGDVTVDVEREALAKAENTDEARKMLQKISGKTHHIRDAYAIYYKGKLYNSGVVTAAVTFKDLSVTELNDYLELGEWEGKAGAYAVQGQARKLITNIVGSYYDILGLPVYQVYSALVALGIEVETDIAEIYKQDTLHVANVLESEF